MHIVCCIRGEIVAWQADSGKLGWRGHKAVC